MPHAAPRPPRSRADEDTQLDIHIGILLRTGMLVSALVILAGGILYLIQHGHDPTRYTAFRGIPPSLRSLSGIVTGTLHGDSLAIIQFGILLLIATPVARVVFSVVGFLMERDDLYVVISAIVLLVLLYSLIWH